MNNKKIERKEWLDFSKIIENYFTYLFFRRVMRFLSGAEGRCHITHSNTTGNDTNSKGKDKGEQEEPPCYVPISGIAQPVK